jgi:hypothetical protein
MVTFSYAFYHFLRAEGDSIVSLGRGRASEERALRSLVESIRICIRAGVLEVAKPKRKKKKRFKQLVASMKVNLYL